MDTPLQIVVQRDVEGSVEKQECIFHVQVMFDEHHGILEDRFYRLREDEERAGIGDHKYINEWPKDPAWGFETLHRGDTDLSATIEHESTSRGRIEGGR